MELFNEAKDRAVRLKSHHSKFLIADSDGEGSVSQHGNGSSKASRWKVELAPGASLVCLKSVATGLYLSVSDKLGKRVVQAPVPMEWTPLKEGDGRVMLRGAHTRTFLVANGTQPPWRNALTHDLLCATAKVDWAIWVVEVVNEDPTKDLEQDRKMKRMADKDQEDQLRRSYTVPANSFPHVHAAGNGSPPPLPLRSVRTMSPRRQNTILSNSFINRGTTTINSDKHLSPELQMAQQAFKEMQHLDFKSVFSSEKLKSIESAISVFLSYTNHNSQRGSTTKSKLLSIIHHLQTLKFEQKKWTNELEEYEDFRERKEYKMRELHREVGRAHELEAKERKSHEELAKARGNRKMLLREMEKAEMRIKWMEEEQNMNEGEMEMLFTVIAQKSEGLKLMDFDENLLVKKKVMAERSIEEIETHWVVIKDFFIS